MTKNKQRTSAVVLALIGSTAVALAQPVDTPVQTTQDPVVAADGATHIALLAVEEGMEAAEEVGGAAWLIVDPQNTTVNWTIEYTGIEPITAEILCGDGDDAGTLSLNEDEMDSPIEGEMADLDQQLFDAILGGECDVVLTEGEDEGDMTLRGTIEASDRDAAAAPGPAPGDAAAEAEPVELVASEFTTETVAPNGPFAGLAIDRTRVDQNLENLPAFLARFDDDGLTELRQRCVVITDNEDLYDDPSVRLCNAVLDAARNPATGD